MDLPKNHFKAALARMEQQIGVWVTTSSPDVSELLAGCGYDWMLLDTEHATTVRSELVGLLRAVAPYPVTPVVRPGWNDPVEIKRLLDAGAQTLLIPYVQNAEEARAAVAAVRYPPQGVRGMAGASRATRYGAIEGYAGIAEQELCLLVQAETQSALAEVEAIAQVDGVDGVFIGPADLAASMGHAADINHPEVRAAVLDGLRRIRGVGKAAGVLTVDSDFAKLCAESGAVFIAIDVDMAMLRRSAVCGRSKWA